MIEKKKNTIKIVVLENATLYTLQGEIFRNIVQKINESEFALNDISLYLDLHPNDYDMYRKFREETNKYKEYLNRYERMYRPLELTSTYTDTYDYYNNPWPWDNDGGIKYV